MLYVEVTYGYIMNECDQLPVGLIAQLVEECTSIAEVMGSNLIQAWIFLGFNFRTNLQIHVVFILTFVTNLLLCI